MLIPLTEIKTYLGESSTTYDTFLTLQGEIISDAIEEYCNRKFLKANYVETFYFHEVGPTNKLYLHHYPIVSLTSVEEVDGSGNKVVVSGYRHHNPSGTITKSSGNFRSYATEVKYSAGYETLPPLIKSVLLNLIQERYNKKKSGVSLDFGSDVQRISIPGTISIDFDFSLENNTRKSHLGVILGNNANILDAFRSDRAVLGNVRLAYVD